MADTTLTNLPAAGTLTGPELVYGVTPAAGSQPAADVKMTLDQLAVFLGSKVGSVWTTGTGTAALAAGYGKNGDFFLDGSTGNVWTKTAGTWGNTGTNIKGAIGSSGAAGANGSQGIQGIQGPSGTNGTNGIVTAVAPLVLSGSTLTLTTQDVASLPIADMTGAAALLGFGPDGNGAQFNLVKLLAWSQTTSYNLTTRQLDITADTRLDASNHNNTLLRATTALTILPPASLPNFGAGNSCKVLNDSTGTVTFGTGIVGASTLAAGQMAQIFSYTGASGQVIRAAVFGGTSAITNIVIAAITSQVAGASFTVSGTLYGYTSAPVLGYSIDGTTYTVVTGGTVSNSAFSFTVPGMTAGTGKVIYVRDGSGVTAPATSNGFTVTAPVIPTITIAPGSGLAVASGSGTTSVPVSITLSAFSSVPTLLYSIDGSAPSLTLPGGSSVSSTAASFTLTGVAAGTFTLRVRDSGALAAVAPQTYTVAGATLSDVPTTGYSGQGLNLASTTATLTGIATGYAVLATASTDQGTRRDFTSTAALRALTLAPATTGAYTLRVYDAASGGNLLAESGTITVSVAPTITISALSSVPFVPPSGTGPNVTFAGTLANFGSVPAALQYSLDGGAYVTASGLSSLTATAFAGMTINSIAAGAHTLVVKDPTTGTTSAGLSFNVEGVTITSVPTSGWTASAATVLTGATATLTGISTAYAVLHDGSSEVGSRQAFTSLAAFAALSFTPAAANSSTTVRVYDAVTAGNLLAQSAAFTVASAGLTILPNTANATVTVGQYTFHVPSAAFLLTSKAAHQVSDIQIAIYYTNGSGAVDNSGSFFKNQSTVPSQDSPNAWSGLPVFTWYPTAGATTGGVAANPAGPGSAGGYLSPPNKLPNGQFWDVYGYLPGTAGVASTWYLKMVTPDGVTAWYGPINLTA